MAIGLDNVRSLVTLPSGGETKMCTGDNDQPLGQILQEGKQKHGSEWKLMQFLRI